MCRQTIRRLFYDSADNQEREACIVVGTQATKARSNKELDIDYGKEARHLQKIQRRIRYFPNKKRTLKSSQ